MSRTDPGQVARLEAVLPQTQCTKCGYPSCRDYALALVREEAAINQCPPGGEQGIRDLAALLNRPYQPLNPAHGKAQPRQVALIDEQSCIGCTLCIQACPVDAIIGGPKAMHTVLTVLCTGCDLCMPPCPVDCIEMVPAPSQQPDWGREQAEAAAGRFRQRQTRLSQHREEQPGAHAGTGAEHTNPEHTDPLAAPGADSARRRRTAIIEQAMQRARRQRQRSESAGNNEPGRS